MIDYENLDRRRSYEDIYEGRYPETEAAEEAAAEFDKKCHWDRKWNFSNSDDLYVFTVLVFRTFLMPIIRILYSILQALFILFQIGYVLMTLALPFMSWFWEYPLVSFIAWLFFAWSAYCLIHKSVRSLYYFFRNRKLNL